jgi:DNA-binding HxlR family transcriptional regulator
MSSLTHAQKTSRQEPTSDCRHRPAGTIEGLPDPTRAIEAQLAVLDDYWNAPILAEILTGAIRFRRIARNLHVSSPTLDERLKDLVELGLLERRVWSEQDVEYEVTTAGRRLLSLWVQRMRRCDVHADNGSGANGHRSAGGRSDGARNGASLQQMGNGSSLELSDPEAQRALALLGVRWNLLILGQLYLGRRRFTEIMRAIGITNRTLSERLKQLLESGIIERRQYQASRYEYWLTARGRALTPVVLAAFEWAQDKR